MAELLPKRLAEHHDHIWRCMCSDWHFVVLSWNDADKDWRYLSITDTWAARRFGDRVRGAWKLLRGRYHYGAEILLDEETVTDLMGVLGRLSEKPKP